MIVQTKNILNINEYTGIEELSKLFSVLGNTIRIKIIYNLKAKEKSALDLAELINCEPSLISHHIKILQDENIVISIKKGRHKFYYINNLSIIDILNETFITLII